MSRCEESMNNRHKSTIKSIEPYIYLFVGCRKADNLKLPRSPYTRARRDIVARRGGMRLGRATAVDYMCTANTTSSFALCLYLSTDDDVETVLDVHCK
jgi:hypothetical protein